MVVIANSIIHFNSMGLTILSHRKAPIKIVKLWSESVVPFALNLIRICTVWTGNL